MIMKMIQRHKKLIELILALWLIGINVSWMIAGDEWLFGDAWDYWVRGCSLWSDNQFSLLNMGDGFRGYVYPLYLGVCNWIGGKKGFITINSLLIALFMAVIVPKLHEFSGRIRIKGIISYAMFGVLFVGLVVYPLSDLFAIMLCSVSIVLERKLEKCNGVRKGIVLGMFLGAVMYLTYNVRTIYLFADVIIIVKFLANSLKTDKKRVILLSCLGVGVLLAAIPQIYMNYFMLGVVNIKVPTGGLMLNQVFWGIQYQRYDTYIGSASEHPIAGMYFRDPVGSRLLLESGIDGFGSWKEFLFFVLSTQ